QMTTIAALGLLTHPASTYSSSSSEGEKDALCQFEQVTPQPPPPDAMTYHYYAKSYRDPLLAFTKEPSKSELVQRLGTEEPVKYWVCVPNRTLLERATLQLSNPVVQQPLVGFCIDQGSPGHHVASLTPHCVGSPKKPSPSKTKKRKQQQQSPMAAPAAAPAAQLQYLQQVRMMSSGRYFVDEIVLPPVAKHPRSSSGEPELHAFKPFQRPQQQPTQPLMGLDVPKANSPYSNMPSASQLKSSADTSPQPHSHLYTPVSMRSSPADVKSCTDTPPQPLSHLFTPSSMGPAAAGLNFCADSRAQVLPRQGVHQAYHPYQNTPATNRPQPQQLAQRLQQKARKYNDPVAAGLESSDRERAELLKHLAATQPYSSRPPVETKSPPLPVFKLPSPPADSVYRTTQNYAPHSSFQMPSASSTSSTSLSCGSDAPPTMDDYLQQLRQRTPQAQPQSRVQMRDDLSFSLVFGIIDMLFLCFPVVMR
ncbi:hypothetical protein PMAYCL1PPCAC_10950, partial [Pristionchus mayeri]